VKNTYTIKEAQQDITGMVRATERGNLATITRHQKPVAYVLSPQRLSELLETMEILADPKAMQAIREAEAGRGKVYAAKDLPE
jgi:antitoxin YefM